MNRRAVDRICITGLGMVSALGRDVCNACAAARARLTRISVLRSLNFQVSAEFGRETLDGFPSMVGHVVPGMGGFVGMARLLLLGSAALADLLAHRPLTAAELPRTGIHINLSDQFLEEVFAAGFAEESGEKKLQAVSYPSQRWVEETSGLIPKILARCGIAIPLSNQALYYGGHAGIVNAIHDAFGKMRAGSLDLCLVAGLDSCVEVRFLQAAAGMSVLKTNDNPVGFLPGEAAGFVLLERVSDTRDVGHRPNVDITGIAVAQDSSHHFSDAPPTGRTLEHVIRQALLLDSTVKESLALMVGDLNGNECRAVDWGHAQIRLNADYHIGTMPFWLPAVSFGETGAATGVLSICLAVKGFERGYTPGNSALLWLASDDGRRGAIVLQSSQL